MKRVFGMKMSHGKMHVGNAVYARSSPRFYNVRNAVSLGQIKTDEK